MKGPGTVITRTWQQSGAGHGGVGGRGSCGGNFKTCRHPRGTPYGSLFEPEEFGSGGDGPGGGTGGGVLNIKSTHTLQVRKRREIIYVIIKKILLIQGIFFFLTYSEYANLVSSLTGKQGSLGKI